MNEETSVVAVRNYKDSVFRMLFKDKSNLLSLFNAINDTCYENPDELEINTLENAVYMSMKNDISCVLDMQLNLYEQQSTVNPNMPLRDLFYVARLYEKMVLRKDLYSKKPIKIPTPKFVTLYNGTDKQPARKILRLSDLYETDTGERFLELLVIQINISSLRYNSRVIRGCQILYEYVRYVEHVRMFGTRLPLQEAVEKAVELCIQSGILADFLRENKAEVIAMSIFEYNQDLHEKALLDDERVRIIQNMIREKCSPEMISRIVSQPIEYVLQVMENMPTTVCEESQYGNQNDEMN